METNLSNTELAEELVKALLSANVAEIESLLLKGADPNHLSGTSGDPVGFSLAKNTAHKAYITILKHLIDRGFDVTKVDGHFPVSFVIYTNCYHFPRDAAKRSRFQLNLNFLLETAAKSDKEQGQDTCRSLLVDMLHTYHASSSTSMDMLAGIVYFMLNYSSWCDWNMKGTRGMSALHWLATMHRIDCSAMLSLNPTVNINIQDMFGCTPLHLACAYNNAEMIQALCRQGAKKHIPDHLGYRPLCWLIKGTMDNYKPPFCPNDDYALYRPTTNLYLVSMFLFHQQLSTDDQAKDTVADAVRKHKATCHVCSAPNWYSLAERAVHRKFFSGIANDNYQKYMTYRCDPNMFIYKLLTSPHLGLMDMTSHSVQKVVKQIHILATRLVSKVSEIQPLFVSKLVVAGSMAEGTKVGWPDHFDYNMILTKMSNCPLITPRQFKTGFAGSVKWKDQSVYHPKKESSIPPKPGHAGAAMVGCLRQPELMLTKLAGLDQSSAKVTFIFEEGVSTEDGVIISYLQQPEQMIRHIARAFDTVLSDSSMWDDLCLYWRDSQTWTLTKSASVLTLNLIWTGREFPELPITLTMIPMFELDKWPPGVISANCDLIPCAMRKQNCFVTVKSGLLSLSSWQLELYMMKQMPVMPRLAYVVCKSFMKGLALAMLKNCKSWEQCSGPSSYILKNALFHVWTNTMDTLESNSDIMYCTDPGKESKYINANLSVHELEQLRRLAFNIFDKIKSRLPVYTFKNIKTRRCFSWHEMVLLDCVKNALVDDDEEPKDTSDDERQSCWLW